MHADVDGAGDLVDRMTWAVEVDGNRHTVELDWTYWGGYRGVRVDGQLVTESTLPMRWKSEQGFALGGSQVVVRTRPSSRVSPFFVIELEVDGRPVAPLPGPRSAWQR